jgi:hypothetical protein
MRRAARMSFEDNSFDIMSSEAECSGEPNKTSANDEDGNRFGWIRWHLEIFAILHME